MIDVGRDWSSDAGVRARAAVHAALGEPARLAVVEELASSDRSPRELVDRLAIPSNLLAHHLDVLEECGLVTRSESAGDRRRRYVRLVRPTPVPMQLPMRQDCLPGEVLFLCTHNSARSQLAAALWVARTGRRATSAGTSPAARVHRGAVAAARRAGVSLAEAVPAMMAAPAPQVQVVTVCDLVHEQLQVGDDWWHWSIPDPVEDGSARAFDAVVEELETRIAPLVGAGTSRRGRNS